MNKLNIIDKTIGFFSPTYEYKATQLRTATHLMYDGATQSPHYNISSYETTPNEDIEDLITLRATSNDKYKNNGFYNGVIQSAVDHTIGSGLKAKSTINRRLLSGISEDKIKQIEDNIDDYFNSWANSTVCDISGKDNFYIIQRLAYQTFKKDGDCFATLPLIKFDKESILQIDLIGSSNIQSNDSLFVEGIRVNKNNRPIQYSILQSDNSYKKIRAFKGGKKNILHLFKKDRPHQLRGIPFLTPVMRDIDAIDQYMKYELTATKLASIFFGSITSKSQTDIFGKETDFLNPTSQKQTEKNTVKENSITQLSVDEELKIHSQGRDNPNFDKYIMTNLQKVSTHTRIPLEIIIAKFVSSYSASRASMLLMQKFTKPERDLFNTSFNNPIREQVVTWGVLSGDLNIPDFMENKGAYLKCMWIGDPMGSVDPQKDVKAKVSAKNENWLTNEQATSDLGYGDFESNVNILKKERELLKKQGLLIKEEEQTNELQTRK